MRCSPIYFECRGKSYTNSTDIGEEPCFDDAGDVAATKDIGIDDDGDDDFKQFF